MKENEFKIGRWYKSSKWVTIFAAKFERIACGRFEYSECVKNNYHHSMIGGTSVSDEQDWDTFTEVSVSDVYKYLIKEAASPINLLKRNRYLKWVDNTGTQNTGSQCALTVFIKDKLFDTKIERPPAGAYTDSWVTHLNVYPYNYLPISEEEYFAKIPTEERGLAEFPKQGYCKNISKDFIDFLRTRYPSCKRELPPNKEGIAWSLYSYWTVSIASNKKEYTFEQIKKFITPKKEENGIECSKTTDIDLPTKASENRRSNLTATVAIRSGRQQVAVGSRPKGNSARVDTGETRFRHIKICKSAVKRANY